MPPSSPQTGRPVAAHVQAALAGAVQPRMPVLPAVPTMPASPGQAVRVQAPPLPRNFRAAALAPVSPQPQSPPRSPVLPPAPFRPVPPARSPVAPPVAVPSVQAHPAPAAPRPVAPHVQAALGRNVQAPILQARSVQAKLAPSAGRAPVVQRMLAPVVDDGVTRGENRDGETVNTAGGTWTAVRYVALERYGYAPAWGAFMNLKFTPKSPANATKIALVQTVLAFKNGEFYHHNNATTESRAFAGASIDQAPTSRSPFYADNPTTGGSGLGSSSVQQNAGEHGYRYTNWWGTLKVKDAWLRDTPHLRDVTDHSSQLFETTALAVEGVDKGTYYGSVKWGWRRRPNDTVALDQLQVVSQGSVSEAFKSSLGQWNKTKTSNNQTPQQLPNPG